MRPASRTALIVLAVLGGGLGAAGAQGNDACAAFKWSIAAEQAALAASDLPTMASGQAYPAVGQGVEVQLAAQGSIAYSVAPTHKPHAASPYGAELKLADAGTAGTLAVTLSDDAWVDLVQDGKVLRSTAFSGKTGCPGIRKSVRFNVAPGPVAIAISDAPAATIRMDVTAVP